MTEYLSVIFHFCLGTLFLLFGINLILRKGLTASKLLGIQFTLLALTLIISYYLTEENILDHPYFFRSLSPPIYLIGPLSVLIQQFLLYPNRKFKRIYLLHFIPFIFHFVEYIPYYLSSKDAKLDEIRFIINNGNLSASTGNFGWLPMSTHIYLKGCSILIYSVWLGFDLYNYFKIKGFRILKRNNNIIIKWVLIDFSMKIVAVLFILYYFITMKIIGLKSSFELIFIYILFSVNYLFEAFYLMLNPQMLVGPTLSGFFTKKELEEFSNGNTPTKKSVHVDHILKIQNLFETELIFLNPDLKIINISERLGLSASQISSSIKQAHGQSFPEFVNSCRLTYLKDELKHNPIWKKYTTEALAFESGFKNRQTFHFACKSIYGLSAADFLLKIKK
jgi:AraC-like DNA-binding protein